MITTRGAHKVRPAAYEQVYIWLYIYIYTREQLTDRRYTLRRKGAFSDLLARYLIFRDTHQGAAIYLQTQLKSL